MVDMASKMAFHNQPSNIEEGGAVTLGLVERNRYLGNMSMSMI
jgi:hypothetical protein